MFVLLQKNGSNSFIVNIYESYHLANQAKKELEQKWENVIKYNYEVMEISEVM